MREPPKPLRFLALVLGGWICIRAAILFPGAEQVVAAEKAAPAQRDRAVVATLAPVQAARQETVRSLFSLAKQARPLANEPYGRVPAAVAPAAIGAERPAVPEGMAAAHPLSSPAAAAEASRWSASAWLFHRRGGGASLAAAGTLGGSQAGARLTYRLNDEAERPLAIAARLYAPLRQAKGAEAALGLEWKPLRHVPVRLAVERREALGRAGRSAFAVMAHGGLYRQPIAGPLSLDLYAQAGMVGAKSRDLFADGSAVAGADIGGSGRVRAGLGLWAAAQPGVSRLDLGPHLSYSLPAAGRAVRLDAEWRFRAAGPASPASGPAVTLAFGF